VEVVTGREIRRIIDVQGLLQWIINAPGGAGAMEDEGAAQSQVVLLANNAFPAVDS
jgi:hypothetical protein